MRVASHFAASQLDHLQISAKFQQAGRQDRLSPWVVASSSSSIAWRDQGPRPLRSAPSGSSAGRQFNWGPFAGAEAGAIAPSGPTNPCACLAKGPRCSSGPMRRRLAGAPASCRPTPSAVRRQVAPEASQTGLLNPFGSISLFNSNANCPGTGRICLEAIRMGPRRASCTVKWHAGLRCGPRRLLTAALAE